MTKLSPDREGASPFAPTAVVGRLLQVHPRDATAEAI